MCLAAFALNVHPRFPLVIAANRDEFFTRAAAPMAWWPDRPNILAGRDLSAGGSWFGLSRAGRLALLTNVREPGQQRDGAPSRGALVVDWLASQAEAASFAAELAGGYNGFNLVTADLRRPAWHWISNRVAAPAGLGAGIHALSNAALDTPWPKAVGLKTAMAEAVTAAADAQDLAERLLQVLADDRVAPDHELPDTGVGLARERLLSPRFIRIPDPAQPATAAYGTRCSTVLVREAGGATRITERSVSADGRWLAPVTHILGNWP
ncbi:MAG: NRDE family protein [Roseateles sp.]|uniref:NRDE family protein n=1 Tax=Roseateles sp. TaxID=1971397 RepID=UPI004036AD58